MSCSFTLNFARVTNLQSAFELAFRATEMVFENIDTMIELSRFSIPAIRNADTYSDMDRFWLDSAIKLNFTYWSAENLIALSGDLWPKEVIKLLPRQVQFQDGTDQDYPFETWAGICSLMDFYVDQCRWGKKDCIDQIMQRHYGNFVNAECDEATVDFSYYRRWACYTAIIDSFCLDAWINGENNAKYIRFSMSPLTTPERAFTAHTKLKSYVMRENHLI